MTRAPHRDQRHRPSRWRPLHLMLLLALLLAPLAAGSPAGAQVRIAPEEDLDFDRPEAWGMKWFASVARMTGLGPPADLEPGSWDLGAEAGWIPHLSEEERRIGFLGEKVEDVNRSDVFGRLRAAVGLPRGFVLELGYTPPVEVDGMTPHLGAVALARSVVERTGWELALRGTVEGGTIEGDVTCPEDVVEAGLDDRVRNPFRCREPSDDEMTVRSGSLELAGALHPRSLPRLTPYASVAGTWLDTEFRVRARYGSIVDRSLLTTDGVTWSATAGARWELGERTGLSGELFYSPLDVVREPERGEETDGLFNARLMVTYRVR